MSDPGNFVRPIYLITDGGKFRADGSLTKRIREALIGAGQSIYAVQLREQVAGGDVPPASDQELIKLARELIPICRDVGVKLVINRNVDVAISCGADGVHFGATSNLPAEQLVREGFTVGCSVHNSLELASRNTRTAEYLLLSPIFLPKSKISTRQLLGLDGLRQAVSQTKQLVFALGGIDSGNTACCRQAGASGVAMISAILASDDPKIAAKNMAQAWQLAV